eukprot:scaffold370_cov349-Pavlova_lutheri.AAC.9
MRSFSPVGGRGAVPNRGKRPTGIPPIPVPVEDPGVLPHGRRTKSSAVRVEIGIHHVLGVVRAPTSRTPSVVRRTVAIAASPVASVECRRVAEAATDHKARLQATERTTGASRPCTGHEWWNQAREGTNEGKEA